VFANSIATQQTDMRISLTNEKTLGLRSLSVAKASI